MTHYFESILPKVLAYSQKLDKLALLLDEPCVVAGDSDTQTKLIFRTGGSILVSENGTVAFGKWELLNRANSIVVEYGNSAKLYNHRFFDEAVLALKLDGTNDFFILVNQNRVPDLNVAKYIKNKYVNESTSYTNLNTKPDEGRIKVYDTDKGSIVIHQADHWRGSKVYLNNKPAPNGRYELDFMFYVHVLNGQVSKTTMF